MDNYDIAVVLWDDHQHVTRSEIPHNLDDFFSRPVLSVGIIYKETEKTLILLSNIDRREETDEADYMVILKSAIVGIKKYGQIELDNLRTS